jgi:hypothetical protein
MIKVNEDKDSREIMMKRLTQQRQLMGRRSRITNESLILRFFKYLITKLPDRNVVFDISKGTIKTRSGGEFRT